jgi:hypothetical protein
MPTDQAAVPTLQDHLAEPLRIGPADHYAPLAVFPLFGAPCALEYRSFAQARAHGVTIRELAGGASVNDLEVLNPTDMPVLLYEGEEVLGAQQNRTFDVSVLVPAGAALKVPVSCVEHGRWDGSRHAERFRPAPQAAYPSLRRMKNRVASARVSAGLDARAEQGGVWDEVARKSARLHAVSPTGAMHDIFEGRRDQLDEFTAAMPLHDGQTGALVTLGGTISVLDHVSRPEVFATLHAPLVHGYALDAIEATDAPSPSLEDAQAFLGRVLTARLSHHDGIGLGSDVRLSERRISGAGLVAGEELVQLTVFGEDGHAGAGQTRIRRPSRRR